MSIGLKFGEGLAARLIRQPLREAGNPGLQELVAEYWVKHKTLAPKETMGAASTPLLIWRALGPLDVYIGSNSYRS
jgi:hypothetical protein